MKKRKSYTFLSNSGKPYSCGSISSYTRSRGSGVEKYIISLKERVICLVAAWYRGESAFLRGRPLARGPTDQTNCTELLREE